MTPKPKHFNESLLSVDVLICRDVVCLNVVIDVDSSVTYMIGDVLSLIVPVVVMHVFVSVAGNVEDVGIIVDGGARIAGGGVLLEFDEISKELMALTQQQASRTRQHHGPTAYRVLDQLSALRRRPQN